MTTKAMSPLQQRMLEDMQLRGLSARTQEAYARAVWQLAQYYRRSPDKLGDAELRQYFLYLTNEKKLARPTATIALCGIKFFYEQTLKQPWPTLRFVRPPRAWKLPVVLNRKEVRRILQEVRIPVYRACLTTIYACGLRLLEGSRLQVPDVDSAALHLLTPQSVTLLSRTAFVRHFVKQWVLLREAIASHRSYPDRPTRLKPALPR
jgi:integrase